MSANTRNIRPQVTLPKAMPPMPLLILLGGLLCIGILLTRQSSVPTMRHTASSEQDPAALDLPPLAMPAMALPADASAYATTASEPPPRLVRASQTAAFLPAPPSRAATWGPGIMGRLPENGGLVGETLPPPRMASANTAASPLVIDLTRGNGVGANDTPPAGDQGSGEETAHASLIAGRATLIPQGAIIAAVLETPLNSDRPGLARAVVAQDVRGFDGARVLIPRGSRLIGEFKAETSPGMRRIQVMWTRLIRPDGAAIRITSPAADTMGGAGIAGAANTHAIERFASAVLQSALTVGVNVASTMASGGSGTIYLGLPGQGTQLGQQLVPNTARPATIKVREGASISVLVARDLDFAGMPAVR